MVEEVLRHAFESYPLWALFLVVAVSVVVLGKGADILVDEAVALSLKWGVPPTVIGATIVSLGTTLPEAAVSVAAAVAGNPQLALGNAVGSIICDTGLILGLACILAPLPLNRAVVNRQGWLQLGSGFLLVAACVPWSNLGMMFDRGPEGGGNLAQPTGWLFLVLLLGYLWLSFHWSKKATGTGESVGDESEVRRPAIVVVLKLVLGIAMVVGAAQVLIPAVEIIAEKLNVPQEVIAATLVAFGTSLPELVTAITSVRKGHGEIAIGNVIGADILNVLFVAGAAAAVTPGGLQASANFFILLFPAMIALLLLFRVGIAVSGTHLTRPFGFLLLAGYVVYFVLNYQLS